MRQRELNRMGGIHPTPVPPIFTRLLSYLGPSVVMEYVDRNSSFSNSIRQFLPDANVTGDGVFLQEQLAM